MTARTEAELELVLQVWECERRLDYPAIRALLEPLPLPALLANEELALLLLYAHIRLADISRAAELAELLAPLFPPERSDRNRRRYLFVAADLLLHGGRTTEFEALTQELHEQALQAHDTASVLRAVVNLGVRAGIRGDFVNSIRYMYRGLAIPTAVDGGRWTPMLHHNLAISYRELGMIAEAERHFEQSARYPRPEWMQALTSIDRAILLHVVGEAATAERLAQHALATMERAGTSGGMAECWYVLGMISIGTGELGAARRHLDRAAELLPPGNLLLAAQLHEEFAVLHLLDGDADAGGAARAGAERLYAELDALPRVERMRLRLEVVAAGNAAG